jgi:hypothetical protein
MDQKEKDWYLEFKKATEYHNWQALQYLCEIAPTDQYERIRQEIAYELERPNRERYEIPTSKYNSTYTEWSYGWAAPKRNANRRQDIDKSYETENTNPEFYTAPGKKVRFK